MGEYALSSTHKLLHSQTHQLNNLTMKRLLTIALSALFAVHAAEARTLYVNASRPNNKGSGLSLRTAKKTIQAAINIAKKGDTILVYPGTYAPIKTKNKKITIKSVKGKGKTKIAGGGGWSTPSHAFDFGDGDNTVANGFHVCQESYECGGGAIGGKIKNCAFTEVGRVFARDGYGNSTFFKTSLSKCLIENCMGGTGGYPAVYDSKMNCCTVKGVTSGGFQKATILNSRFVDGDMYAIFEDCTLANSLFAGNNISDYFDEGWINSSTVVNCTIAGNKGETGKLSVSSKFVNCIIYGNKKLKKGSGNTYTNTDKTNKNPKFLNPAKGDYRLGKNSYAIDSGKVTKAQKKLVGSKDLAGKKRIRGKTIDRGCYEY